MRVLLRLFSGLAAGLGFPPIGRHGRFVTAIGVDALGSGVFMPLSILYFLAVTPLSVVEVGLALSIAAAVTLPAGPFVGALVDRWGAKRMLRAGNLLQAAGMAGYLVSQSLAAVVACTLVVSLGRTAFWGSYGNIVTAITRPGERERWFGFLGALRNVGFALGGLMAGAAVAVGSDLAFHAVVAVNGASYLVSWWLLGAVPDPRPTRTAAGLPGSWGDVLRDRAYLVLVAAQVGYSMPMMILNIALPVYAVTVLDLPGWLTGAMFTVNCIMVGLGQGLVVSAMSGRVRFRMLLLCQVAFAASFVLFLSAAWWPVVVGTGVMLVGTVVYTLGELVGGPVTSATAAEAAPDHLRGRYLSLGQLSWGVSGAVAPVLFAWLLAQGSAPLWLVMLVLTVVSSGLVLWAGRVLPAAAQRVSRPPMRDPVAG